MIISSCNKILFEKPMPISGSPVYEIPNKYLGEFLELKYDSNSVYGYYKRIKPTSENVYTIESQDVVFMDSLAYRIANLDTIENVRLLDNQRIEIKSKARKIIKSLCDTISSGESRVDFEIDLEKGILTHFYYGKKGLESVSRKCELRIYQGDFYLNTLYFEKYWFLRRFQFENNSVKISTSNFPLYGNNQIEFDEVEMKYKLQEIFPDDHKNKSKWRYFTSDSDDSIIKEILDEKLLNHTVWYKIEKGSSHLIWGVIGIIIFLFLIKKFSKK